MSGIITAKVPIPLMGMKVSLVVLVLIFAILYFTGLGQKGIDFVRDMVNKRK